MHPPRAVGDEKYEGNWAAPAKTSWISVLLAVAAGVFAASQLGKVHIALPSIRGTFSLSLVSASWILSALNVVGLLAATPAGTLCARMGNKRGVVLGLGMIAVSSAAGGFSPTVAWLLITRLVEGIGFVMVVVAAPSLIVEVTGTRDLRLALAGWSAFMPGGIALTTALAPLVLARHSWRAVWEIEAASLLILAVLIAAFSKPGTPAAGPPEPGAVRKELGAVLTSRGPMLLAIIFGMFTMQYLSIMGFLPTLLLEKFHLSEETTGILVSIAMATNILGNLAAGVLLQRGFSRARIIALTSIFMACMAVAMFSLRLPLDAFYVCAVAFSCVGGLIPSSVMGAAPYHTPSPSLLGATNGLLVQGSNLGIVLGPPVVSMIATRYGWNYVPLATGLAAALAAVLACNLRTPEGLETHVGMESATEQP